MPEEIEISVDEMEERDERFWKSRAGRRVLRRTKSRLKRQGTEPRSKEETKSIAKSAFKPEWWANIKKDGSLGRTTYSSGPRAIEQRRENQIGSAHWHSAREKAEPSPGDKSGFIFRKVAEPFSEKNHIQCVHTNKETCCYDLRDFDKTKVESDVASEMWDEGVNKEIIKKKCKKEGEIIFKGC